MANPVRGEVDFVLGGVTYAVAPVFKAIAEVEALHGPSPQIIQAFRENKVGVIGVVSIMQLLMRHQERAPRAEDIPDLVIDAGALNFVLPICQLLERYLTGGRRAEASPGNGTAAASTAVN